VYEWAFYSETCRRSYWLREGPSLPGCDFQHGHFLVHFTGHTRLGRRGVCFGHEFDAEVRSTHVAVLHQLLDHLAKKTHRKRHTERLMKNEWGTIHSNVLYGLQLDIPYLPGCIDGNCEGNSAHMLPT